MFKAKYKIRYEDTKLHKYSKEQMDWLRGKSIYTNKQISAYTKELGMYENDRLLMVEGLNKKLIEYHNIGLTQYLKAKADRYGLLLEMADI